MKKTSLLLLIFMFSTLLFAEDSNCVEGNYLVFQKENNHSIKSLQDILQKNPNDMECLVKLINLYLKNGEVSKGFELLVRAYKKDPNFIKTKKIYKIVHVAQYITQLEKKAKEANSPKYWNLLGLNYYKMGVFKEAIKCYRNSLKVDPDQIEPRLNLAIALSRVGQKYMALEELSDIIKKDKNNFYAYYYTGKILEYQIGDKDKAKRYLQKAKMLCKAEKSKFSKKMYELYMKDLDSETGKK